MSNLFSLTCPRCGGDITKKLFKYTCNHCGKSFEKDNTLIEDMRTVFSEHDQEMVAKSRRQLWEEMHEEHINSEKIVNLAREIKKYLPEDYFACFCEVANSGSVKQVNNFLKNTTPKQLVDYADVVLDFMLKSATEGNLSTISLFIERAFKDDTQNYGKYATKFETEAEKIKAGTYNLTIPRSAFLVYSHKDIEKVIELCDYLESQNISCFMALRNLRHGRGAADNYDNALRTAIDNCNTVVFVSSRSSRSLSCDALKKELPYIKQKDLDRAPAEYASAYDRLPQKYMKPRVEYLIEGYCGDVGESITKEFFHSLEWCTDKVVVAQRIVKYLTSSPALKEEVHKAKETDTAERIKNGKFSPSDFNGEVKYCVNCKTAIKLSAGFCTNCGNREFFNNYNEYFASTIKFCKNCGTQNDETSKFCEECGKNQFVPTYADYTAYQEYLRKEEERKAREAEEARRRAEEERIRREKLAEEERIRKQKEAEEAARRAEEAERLRRQLEKEEAERKLRVAELVKNGLSFGSYPQTKVTDSGLISQLNNLAGTLPTSLNSGKWTSYKYYIENSNATDFMWYCDVSYNGEKYRGVYFDKYRPYWTDSDSSYNNQKGNGYAKGKVYWFKYEPIKWRVLEVRGKEAFVACDKLIDSQDYNHTLDNNYANSSIRKWLNNEFYNAAFNEAEKAKILQSVVDNSLASTCDSSNKYVCANTSDKIFLLSKKEATTALYFKDNQARQKRPTDYALCQGAYSCGW